MKHYQSGTAKKSFLPFGRSYFVVARHIMDVIALALCQGKECYNLEQMMGSLANYFDYESYARELFNWDYTMGANNHVFRRI